MAGWQRRRSLQCKVGVAEGKALSLYSFPEPHIFNHFRAERFWAALREKGLPTEMVAPLSAGRGLLSLFHSEGHIRFVEQASQRGTGFLDQGDTPTFKGIMEAAQFAVGTTVSCADLVMKGELDHAMNPVGGLHNATKEKSAGFCVLNDIGVAIEHLRKAYGVRRFLYVDIDVHHGDGVYYPYESDPAVAVFDVHEDGRYQYPGTGSASEVGKGNAKGTKVNVPLLPGSGDKELIDALPRLEDLAMRTKPEFIIFQCGADGLRGDPIAGLQYSRGAHKEVAKMLHRLAHDLCGGKLIALGGGGYVPENCADAWTAVVEALLGPI